MKTVEMADATASLSDYARKARKESLIVTRKGKPVALMPVDAHTDLENLVVTTHPTFEAIIQRSEATYRAEGGLSTQHVRTRLAARRRSRKTK